MSKSESPDEAVRRDPIWKRVIEISNNNALLNNGRTPFVKFQNGRVTIWHCHKCITTDKAQNKVMEEMKAKHIRFDPDNIGVTSGLCADHSATSEWNH